MEYLIGIEMSDRYLSFEVTGAALKLVRDFMLVKEGENVVITADTSSARGRSGGGCGMCRGRNAGCRSLPDAGQGL